ncbi:1677_t:CDS:2 [Funneliformis geosporum]|nr:1677_t:CDS:2 [Funneliformis geosporum]
MEEAIMEASNHISNTLDIRLKEMEKTSSAILNEMKSANDAFNTNFIKANEDIRHMLSEIGSKINTIATSYCIKKAHDAYENSQKTKRNKYDLKSKSIDAAREDNKKAQEEKDTLQKNYDELDEKTKKLSKDLEETKGKLNRPDLSEEERSSLKRSIVSLQQELDQTNTNKKSILDQLKKLGERIAKNNETINNAGLNPDDKH